MTDLPLSEEQQRQARLEEAIMDLADDLILKYQERVKHVKPLVRTSLNNGYMQGVIDTLRAIEEIRQRVRHES